MRIAQWSTNKASATAAVAAIAIWQLMRTDSHMPWKQKQIEFHMIDVIKCNYFWNLHFLNSPIFLLRGTALCHIILSWSGFFFRSFFVFHIQCEKRVRYNINIYTVRSSFSFFFLITIFLHFSFFVSFLDVVFYDRSMSHMITPISKHTLHKIISAFFPLWIGFAWLSYFCWVKPF